MNSTWKAAIGVLLVFILGWFGGVICGRLYDMHRVAEAIRQPEMVPQAIAEMLERRMTRNLDLDANQQEEIHTYFLENLQQRKLLNTQIQPQIQLANHQTLSEINAILRPDQQTKLRQNLADFRLRFGKNPFSSNPDIDNGATGQNSAPTNTVPPATGTSQ